MSLLFHANIALALSGCPPPQKAEIVVDEFGNPRINAPANHRLFELLGYMVPKYTLWGFEFVKRDSLWTLGEILGPKYLGVDKSRILMGFIEEELQSTFDSLVPEAQEILKSYVRV